MNNKVTLTGYEGRTATIETHCDGWTVELCFPKAAVYVLEFAINGSQYAEDDKNEAVMAHITGPSYYDHVEDPEGYGADAVIS